MQTREICAETFYQFQILADKGLFMPLTVTVMGCLARIYCFLKDLGQETRKPKRTTLAMISDPSLKESLRTELGIPLEEPRHLAEEPAIIVVESLKDKGKRPKGQPSRPDPQAKRHRPGPADEIDDIFGSL